MIYNTGGKIYLSYRTVKNSSTIPDTKFLNSYKDKKNILSMGKAQKIIADVSIQLNPNGYIYSTSSPESRTIIGTKVAVCGPPPSSGSPSTLEYSPFVFDPATQRWCNKT